MKKFPTVCARRSSSKRRDPQGCRDIFPFWRWFGKKRSQPGLCGLASLQPGSETGEAGSVWQPLVSAASRCCFMATCSFQLPLHSRKAKILLGGPGSLGTCVLWPLHFYQELQPCSVSGLGLVLWCHRALAHAVSLSILCVVQSLYTVVAQCWLCRSGRSRAGESRLLVELGSTLE